MAKKRTTFRRGPKKRERKSKPVKLESFDDIQVAGNMLFHTDAAEIDRLEKKLRTKFPSGYREFITRFGEGVLASFVRVYPPHELLGGELSVLEWRKRIRDYWFWDTGKAVLTKARALKCVLVADTLNGDEVIFHPSAPDRLFVLPRYDEGIYAIDGGLLEALRWLLGAGRLTEPIAKFEFEPFDSTAPPPAVASPAPSSRADDLVQFVPIHDRDGTITCRVYRFGPQHRNVEWDGRSPLAIDLPCVITNALMAADAGWGQPARITEIELSVESGRPYLTVKTEPRTGEWSDDRLFNDTVYLDVAGTLIVPTEHLCKNQKAYEKIHEQIFGPR